VKKNYNYVINCIKPRIYTDTEVPDDSSKRFGTSTAGGRKSQNSEITLPDAMQLFKKCATNRKERKSWKAASPSLPLPSSALKGD
jgi:hypothetical protein